MGLFDPGSSIISGLLRGEPNMPAFTPITPGAEVTKTIGIDTTALPGAENLASQVNLFNQSQMQRMLEGSIPGYSTLKGEASGVLESELAGQVSLADQNQQELRSIAKSFGGGFAGSGEAGNLVARDLGLTELGEVQAGLSNTEGWMKTISSLEDPTTFNVQSMFLTPTQVMAQDTEERNAQFQYNWNKNLMDWQSSLGYLAANEITQDSAQFNSMAGSVAGSAAGGAMGGGGGM